MSSSPNHPASPPPARLLGAQRLAALRKECNLTMDKVGPACGKASLSSVWRIESGQVKPRQATLQAMLSLYGVHDPHQRQYVSSLMAGLREPAWYDDPDVPLALATSWDLEQRAAELRTYHLKYIPPLLQTEEYADALCERMSHAHQPIREVANGLLSNRQALLDRPDAPLYWALIDEGVLLRSIGGLQVQLHQLNALIEHAKRPNVIVQVISLRDAPFVPDTESFTVCRFSDRTSPDVAAAHVFATDRLTPTHEMAAESYRIEFVHAAARASEPGRDTLDVLHHHRDMLARTLN
ncbi:helix-turn-helix transcriptional regulator [Nonomuraea sp. NPDC049400]|uniref:helix-turn-helix transcriptional regulator n=1 Tax=Nonomuraea sp. NPDC049400 TaxID=3364352 RepID=UPI003790985E